MKIILLYTILLSLTISSYAQNDFLSRFNEKVAQVTNEIDKASALTMEQMNYAIDKLNEGKKHSTLHKQYMHNDKQYQPL